MKVKFVFFNSQRTWSYLGNRECMCKAKALGVVLVSALVVMISIMMRVDFYYCSCLVKIRGVI